MQRLSLSLLVALALLIASAHADTTGLWEPSGGYSLSPKPQTLQRERSVQRRI